MNYQKENITDVLLREYGIIVLIAIVQSVKVARWGSTENITDVLLREYGIIVLIAIVQSVKVARWGSTESRQAHSAGNHIAGF